MANHMTSAILNIIGGLGMAAFIALMLLRGAWVRRGVNRALGFSLMLASMGTVMLASSLDNYGSSAATLSYIAYAAYALAIAALAFWFMRRRS
jgi:hypothetical protein